MKPANYNAQTRKDKATFSHFGYIFQVRDGKVHIYSGKTGKKRRKEQ